MTNIFTRFYEVQNEADRAKLDHMRMRAAENDEKMKENMIGHLSALNDGVIAIFITVMMLSIPYPKMREDYGSFMWSIAVFLVSFFVIVDFWYENKRFFTSLREADHPVVVLDFIFLASLALIPVTTTWILNDPNPFAVVNYGIVYFLTVLWNNMINFAGLRKRFQNHLGLFIRMTIGRIASLLIANVILILVASRFPRQAMFLYLALPIISFFKPGGKKSAIKCK